MLRSRHAANRRFLRLAVVVAVALTTAVSGGCSDDEPASNKNKDVASTPDITDAGAVVDATDTAAVKADGATCPIGGCACTDDTDCGAAKCVDLGAGKRCQPVDLLLCAPCLTDAECAVIGEGAACVDRGKDGAFCGLPCLGDDNCSEGYVCADRTNREGAAVRQCVPKDAAPCACSPFAKDHGLVTLCQKGACPGELACLPAGHPDAPAGGGLSACRPLQQVEKCDGLDNDCNGKIDDGQACDDGNPCTLDTCVGSTCAHTPAAGACEDGDACTESDQCAGGACEPGKATQCYDDVACTIDTCVAATGCHFEPDATACDDKKPCTLDVCNALGGASPGCTNKPQLGCDPDFIVPHKEPFTCGSKTATKWQLTGVVGGPRWALDKTPDPPGFVSAPCSLNFNDGKSYACPDSTGAQNVSGTATSPWFFDTQHQQGDGLQLRAKISGDWEETGFDDLDILISGDDKIWQKLGNIEWDDPEKWLDLKVDLHEWAGKKFRLRFDFYTLDCINNATEGPFVDDLELSAVPCALADQCNDGDACTTDTCDKAKGCQHAPIPACETPLPIPYVTEFACGGATLGQWSLSNDQNSPGWAIDGTPSAPGYVSAPCSLNFNDGAAYNCKPGTTELHGEATSPRLSALSLPPGSPLFARFSLGGSWEANEWDSFALWGTVDGVEWTKLGDYNPPKGEWEKVSVDLAAFVGQKFWLSFTFTTTDCEENGGSGPFIDDFFVSPTACLTDAQCDDGDPCTADTCKVGFGCQHAAATGPCDDSNACTDNTQCTPAGACEGQTVSCDDESSCTADSCDPKVGCVSKPVDGCGPALKLPVSDALGCGTYGALTWSLSAAVEGPVWAVDGTPSAPGYSSPLCSLNFNDGSSYACAPGQTHVEGAATSHWIDLSGQDPGAKTLLSFQLAGSWEKGAWDRFELRATSDGKAWTKLAEYEHSAAFNWTKHTVDLAAFSAKKLRLRFVFETTDCFDNQTPGPFVDDITIVVPPCAGNADCDDGNPCTDDSCGKGGVCNRVAKTGSCADADKCQIGPVCVAATCTGKAVNCDDSDPCTIDSCAPSKGCKHAAIPGCGGPLTIPHHEPFHCGSPSAGAWQLELGDAVTPVGAPTWGVDSTPNPPGAFSASCSLNFNNGTHFECGPGQTKIVASATSLWFDAKPLQPGADLRLAFELGGQWELADFDKLLLLATTDGKKFVTLASLNHTAPQQWTKHELKIGGLAGQPFKLAWYFETADCVANTFAGPFVDELTVYVAGCDDDLGCDDGDVCTADVCKEDKTCSHALAAVPCSDNDACTVGDLCTPAGCVGAAVSCEDDNNPCTTVACHTQIGCAVDHFVGGCDDGDPCTSGDVCAAGECAAKAKDCDDNNPCTVDACLKNAGGCAYVPQLGPCDDGDACTVAGVCKSGVCASKARCDDHNPCTVDSCKTSGKTAICAYKLWPTGTFCDDGDPCSSADKCSKGTCVAGANSCVCKKPNDCADDGNPCTAASCVAGKCKQTVAAAKTPCTDGDACTAETVCVSGVCAGEAKACVDGNPCTADLCDAKTGDCKHPPLSAACNDGDACTAKDSCAAGTCKGAKVKCDDGNRCTNDSCDPVKGCEHFALADASKCNDDDACTGPDLCKKGSCAAPKLACDDNNPCTSNACHGLSGCSYAPLSGKCDDGNPCTGADTCVGGACSGKPKTCDDRNDCTTDTCDPLAKPGAAGQECKHVVQSSGACDDQDACSVNDACAAGKCVGKLVSCDDGSACTADSCDKKTGKCTATPTPNGGPCDDGDACTVADVCGKGVCVGQPKPCDDNQSCTQDGCDSKGGCTYTDHGDGVPCDDGLACTLKDSCKSGACSGGNKVCLDANPCTADACDPLTGSCVYTPTPGDPVCDDGDKCTSAEKCGGGQCKGVAKVCADGKPCTADVCDPTDGVCSNPDIALGGGCDDGDPCTAQDLCYLTGCNGIAATCDDQNPCTADTCNPQTGCVNAAVADGKACDDGDACTSGDDCNSGACTGKSKDCSDDTPCTADACDPITAACVHVAQDGPCSDSNACTSSDGCVGGACKGVFKVCAGAGPCANVCDPKSGACSGKAGADGAPCDDGAPCTAKATCKSGQCVGVGKACDDGDPCTANQCNNATGACAHSALSSDSPCNDHNPCTTKDRCAAGKCAGIAKDCSDGKPCTADSCSKTGSCQNVPIGEGQLCDDGDGCTAHDACTAGACQGVATICEPLGPCVVVACTQGACAGTAKEDATSCDDGLACTAKDSCAKGECVGAFKACDDKDPCTADYCSEPDGGCKSNAIDDGGSCDDGDLCTTGDVCNSGKCAGLADPCEDGNPCTKGSCQPGVAGGGACVQKPANEGQKCDDGNKCTLLELCAAGVCGGKSITCVGDSCQIGSCDSATGSCAFSSRPNGASCDDANACTADDTCADGTCGGNAKAACSTDGNACLTGKCDPKSGACQFVPSAVNLCSDGDACTQSDACAAGKCVGKVLSCDDGNSCTADSCQKGSGTCLNTPLKLGATCSDGNACTESDACDGGVCAGVGKDCSGGAACTVYSCDAVKGCQATEVSECKSALKLPYSTSFGCGAAASKLWKLGGAAGGAAAWGVDGTPATPGFVSASCSLNFNDGKAYGCGVGQGAVHGVAESPWLDASAAKAGSKLVWRGRVGGSWEGGTHDVLQLVAKIEGQQKLLTLATLAPPVDGLFGPTPVVVELAALVGKKFALQLRFATDDCSNNGGTGPFVDDVYVGEVECLTASDCAGTDACSAGKCVPAPKSGPDLVVSKLEMGPNAAPAQKITFTATVTNSGDKALTKPFDLRFVVNSKADGSGGLAHQWTWEITGGVAAGKTRSISGWFKLDASVAPGPWFLVATVDPAAKLAEIDATNNRRAAPFTLLAPPKPDLRVVALTASENAAAGGAITLSWSVKNTGKSTCPPTSLGLYISPNTSFFSYVLLGSDQVASVAPGATVTGSVTLALGANIKAGKYSIAARADVGKAVAELSEINNAKDVVTSIAAAPKTSNLRPTVLQPSVSNAGVGQKVDVEVAWTNDGNSASGTFKSALFLASADATLPIVPGKNATVVATAQHAPVLPGHTKKFTHAVTVPADIAAGKFQLHLFVDSADQVAESNETDNTAATPLWLFGKAGGPDLVSTATGVAPVDPKISELAPGVEFRFLPGMGCKNIGEQSAGPFAFKVVFSTNTTLTGSDIAAHAGHFVVATGLAGGASYGPFGNKFTVPLGLKPGKWHVGVVCDYSQSVAETDEANNGASFVVQIAGRPQLRPQALLTNTTVVRAGDKLQVRHTVRNLGSSEALARVDRLAFGPAAVATNQATKLIDVAAFKLGPMAVAPLKTTTVTIPAGAQPGEYDLVFLVDANGAVNESDEADNVRRLRLRVVTAKPVNVSGVVTYDRVPALDKTEGGPRLGLDQIVARPARRVQVAALDAADGKTVLATTSTNDLGKFVVHVPAGKAVKIRVYAHLFEEFAQPDGEGREHCKGASWDVRVVDNTAARALYAIESPALTGPKTNLNLHAKTAHNLTAYTHRAGAPFAIADTLLDVFELLCEGEPKAQLPPLYVNWSVNNTRAVNGDKAKGEIGTPHYTSCGHKEAGVCVSAIFLGGLDGVNTDEYDDHLVGHEAGHFVESQFFRSDNIGGAHSVGAVVDPTMAWGEGYGTVYGALALGDPVFVDTSGVGGQKGWQLDLAKPRPAHDRGVFSELATARLVYRLWDRRNGKEGDGIGGFDRAFQVMRTRMAPGASGTTPLAFGAHYNALYGEDAEAFRTLWEADFNTPYDALCVGSCSGKADKADTFDRDNDIGRYYAAFMQYPDPFTAKSASQAPEFWRLYRRLQPGLNAPTAHSTLLLGYPAPQRTLNKVGTNRHYRLLGTGKPMSVRVVQDDSKACDSDVHIVLQVYVAAPPRQRDRLASVFGACPTATFETELGREYLVRVHGGHKVGVGWVYPGGPDANVKSWSVAVGGN